MKIAAGIEYDGSGFRGWQSQPAARNVQDCVERAFSRVADHPVGVVCAGRTDAGVHALGQVIHFETGAERDSRAWMLGANANLPADIVVRWAQPVTDDFHARFAARSRAYRYIILNRDTRFAVLRRHVTWQRRPLDEESMQKAAALLHGEHDFTSFRAAACQARSPVRTVQELAVSREGEFIHIDIRANAFLHHMVRNIAGVLAVIGGGERRPQWAQNLLAARDRTKGGVTAPANGLYLVDVEYDARFGLPRDILRPRFS